MIVNNWSNKHKNNFDYCQRQMRYGTGVSFGLVAKVLDLARALEPSAKPDI